MYILLLLSSFLSFTPFLCEDLPVHSSQLEVIMYNNDDIEFQLKNRENVNVSEINPTSTFPKNLKFLREEEVVATVEDSKKKIQNAPVPLIMSVYANDKGAVDVLKSMINLKPENMSFFQLNLIKKYINEWEAIIENSTEDELNQLPDHSFPELEVPYRVLPTEIQHIYKLYRMMDRTYVQLPRIKKLLEEQQWKDIVLQLENEIFNSEHITTYEDFETTSINIFTLSQFYLKHPKNISSGISPKDLLSVCTSTANIKNIRESLRWVSLAEELFRKTTEEGTEERNHSSTQNGHHVKDIPPNIADEIHFEFTGNYLQIIKSFLLSKLDNDNSEDENLEKNSEKHLFRYKNLCNGKDFRSPKVLSKLFCRYDHLKVPWLYMMPAKIEILHNDPKIILFHDVVRDTKIKKLQQLSLSLQDESRIDGKKEERLVDAKTRYSFVTFIDDIVPEVIELNEVTGYLTGLETKREEDTEPFQVNSYRPGGHFSPHLDVDTTDYLNDDEKYRYFQMIKPHGERMATLMYYLSDVLHGGRTVFTKLGFGVEPEKGAALLWFSLFNDGSVDLRGEHSGCPLLEGLKWVANKWIYYNSQWMKRPCPLQRPENHHKKIEE